MIGIFIYLESMLQSFGTSGTKGVRSSTTPNHSLIACSIVLAVENQLPSIITSGIFLFGFHFLLDTVPHKHWWNNTKNSNPLAKENLLFVIVELVAGLLIIPTIFYFLASSNLFLVFILSLAANLPDLLLVLAEKTFLPLTIRPHAWKKFLPQNLVLRAEITQTILLSMFIIISIYLRAN